MEIKENLLIMPEKRITDYLELILEKVNLLEYQQDLDQEAAYKVAERFGVTLEEIEDYTYNSNDLENIINEKYESFPRRLRDEVYYIQFTLVNYFRTKHITRVLEFCHSKLNHEVGSNKFNETIFTTLKAQEWLENAFNELNIIDDNTKTAQRGFQSVAHAFFQNEMCKELIFSYNIKLKDYIDYLRNTFKAEIKSDKALSDGTIHLNKVDDLISTYRPL